MTNTEPLDRVMNALKNVGSSIRPRSNGCQAQCPAHDDKQASLSVSQGKGGKVLMNCHAGCHIEDILKALNLNFEVLFPDETDNPYRRKKKKKIVSTYDYTDEEGKLLFQGIRFQPKDFRQRQPDGKGGWIWNLRGVCRVLYKLPMVLEAKENGQPIFLVEGEKDASNLINRGLVATTNPMGAGKWDDDHTQTLEGAEVIILPDNDKPGRNHAVAVAKELLGNAKSVKILNLPGLKEKEDVTDWLMQGGSKDELLELAFNTDEFTQEDGEPEFDPEDEVLNLDRYIEKDHKLYDREDHKIIADFAIDIRSVVYDDQDGRIFYIKIREVDRGKVHTTDTIEIPPETLDDTRSFYKAIRPYTTGEIFQYRSNKTKPLSLFKWLLNNFDKPIVRRPDHLGWIQDKSKRPYWLFGNAVVCPPWNDQEGEIIEPNDDEEFIIDERTGFTLPLYKNDDEKYKLAPFVNTDIEGAERLLGEVKEKFLTLVGGGDESSYAENYGKLLLGYVIYHLYEKQLYHANDINGHTVMFYVHGPKGSGKTTYFNTILRAFFGLHNTEETKGNTVSIPALENKLGMYSSLPVCYDEYNPESAQIDYQNINSYYHRTSRQVSDVDRRGRNKYSPIRSTLSFTSNYRINLDVDQADATESRMIYFQYRKEFRSEDDSVFKWFTNHLNELSKITVKLLLDQTEEKRSKIKDMAEQRYAALKKELEKATKQDPQRYAVEHRLTDNYTRLLACYELVFGQDPDFRRFMYEELLDRFASSRKNQKDNTLLNQLAYLASAGEVKECWQYHYSDSKKELYVHLGQLHTTYERYRRDKALSMNQFREILKNYFQQCGGFEVDTRKWYGSYYDRDHQRVDINKPIHSYIIPYQYVAKPDNMLTDLFPPTEDAQKTLQKYENDEVENRDEKDIPF
ncbi:MAG: AAA family ATPase [Bacteroidota bacterium]